MEYVVSASKVMRARAERVYGVLADYRNGHPRVLPPEFSALTVERGGTGEGTMIRFEMRMLGKVQRFHAAISEPEPGRVLVESYLEPAGTVTTFHVDPLGERGGSRVEITTRMPAKPGAGGRMERVITKWLLRRVFERELVLIDEVSANVEG